MTAVCFNGLQHVEGTENAHVNNTVTQSRNTERNTYYSGFMIGEAARGHRAPEPEESLIIRDFDVV